MKRIKLLVASLAVAMFGAFTLVPVASVSALDPLAGVCNAQNADTAVCKNKDESANSLIKTIVNTLLFVVGALSVIMIIVAGIFYVTSTGDSGKVARAKNTLMYAVIGLVVSFLAYAIVNWVMKVF